MKPNFRNIILPAAALVVGLGMASGIAVHAASTSGNTHPVSNLVNSIAQKFNLNAADVQQVFDDNRTQMQAQRQQDEQARLAQAVTDGKLTQDQADKITAKRAELKTQLEADKSTLQNQTQAERHAAMQSQMSDLQQWETDNNIPAGYLRPGFGGHGHGHGMEGRDYNDDDGDDSPQASIAPAASTI